MGDKRESAERFSEILEDIRSGEASLADYSDELEAALPSSILDSLNTVSVIVGKYAAGEISLLDAEKAVRVQADLHPNHPFFFHMCMTYALQRGNELEADGYTALTKTKADRREEIIGEDFMAGVDDVFSERLLAIEQAEEDPYTVFTYLDGGGEHLVNHFLVEDIIASESSLDPEVLELVLKRSVRTVPIILHMLEELLEEVNPSEMPAGFVFLTRILGQLRPREATPVLLAALGACISLPLHETVLALAKLGAAYPEEVSKGLRKLVINPSYGETRLGAVEVLGLLWESAGNLEFLSEELNRLEPDDELYRDMFTFLVSAILSSGRESAFKAVDSSLELHRPNLDTRTIYLTMKYLKKRERTKAGALLYNVLEEDIHDLLQLYPPPQVSSKRRTLTLAREEALKEAMLQSLPTLAEVEERLKTGRDEPCPCGSGKRFRSCCRGDLLEMRELLLTRKEETAGPDFGS